MKIPKKTVNRHVASSKGSFLYRKQWIKKLLNAGIVVCCATACGLSVSAQVPSAIAKQDLKRQFVKLPPYVIGPLAPSGRTSTSKQSSNGNGTLAIPEMKPNDPGYYDQYGQQFSLPQALWLVQNQLNKTARDVVVLVLDEGGDCTKPDLKDNCLAPYNKDFTGEGWSVGPHGTAALSIIGSKINNGTGISGASLTDHVKVVSGKIFNAQGIAVYQAILDGFNYAIELKRKGLNVVAISCSFGGAPFRDQTIADQLLGLHREGIYVGVAATEQFDGSNGKDIDDLFISLPSYSREPNSNVLAFTAWDGFANQLQWASNWGPLTVQFAAPGVAVPVLFGDGTGGFDGTSAAAPGGAALYALIRAERETDADKAADILKASAVMEPSLKGKVGYGRIDAYRALTLNFDQPTTGFVLLNQPGSPRALALDSVNMTVGDFPRLNSYNFSKDEKTRIMLFSPAQLSATSLIMTGLDLYGSASNFPVEYVGQIPVSADGVQKLTQLVARLPDNAPAGDYWLHFTYQGTTSNSVLVTLRP